MGRTYEKCGDDVHELVRRSIDMHHPELSKAGVTFALLFAHSAVDEEGEVKGPALTAGGYPAAAVSRIVGLKDRTKGLADAEIVIDGDGWMDLNPKAKLALIDHELTHFLVRQGEGGPALDDLKRPLLKLRRHDIQAGWFIEVAQRHGEAAQEVRQAREIMDGRGQMCFPWLMPAGERSDMLTPGRKRGKTTTEAAVTAVP